VRALLGSGRKDESGDYTKGAELEPDQIEAVLCFVETAVEQSDTGVAARRPLGEPPQIYQDALGDLAALRRLCEAGGYGQDRIRIDQTVVRGLEYYTGPVFEAEITTPVVNDDGQTVRFGSVGGGGRYDGLVERFLGQKVPAVGFSIGVSRLQAALAALNKDKPAASDGPVVVLVMEKDRLADYQKLVQRLRKPDDGGEPIRAEMYLGTAGMKAQMKYADRRGAPCVVIQGSDERNSPGGPMVQIKDLIEGAKAAATIKDSKEWREARPAQFSVPEANLVEEVRGVLARHRS
jgi:histidyl-tRNA synthetase